MFLYFYVEELSAEAALIELVPRILPLTAIRLVFRFHSISLTFAPRHPYAALS